MRFFERRDRWGNGVAIYVLAAIVFACPLIVLGLRHVSLNNDVTDWLPDADHGAQVLNWYEEHFQKEESFVVSWDGSTLNDPRVEAFAAALEGTPDADGVRQGGIEGVDGVLTPRDLLDRMVRSKIPRDVAVERLRGVLVGTGFLQVQLTDAGRRNSAAVQQQIVDFAEAEIGKPIRFLPPVREADLPTLEPPAGDEAATPDPATTAADAGSFNPATAGRQAENEYAAQGLTDEPFPAIPPHDFQISWEGIYPESDEARAIQQGLQDRFHDESDEPLVENSFFTLGTPVAMFVQLDPAEPRSLKEVLADVEAAAVQVGVPAEDLHLGGTPVGRQRLDTAASRAVWNREYPGWKVWKRSPMLLSALVGMAVAYLLLRSLRLATLVLLVSGYTALAIVALVPATGRTLNMVLIVMPNLLMVLTASGAIHVANYWRHAAQIDSRGAIPRAVAMAARPCVLASLTTGIGLLSLLSSILVPVRDFGMYSAIGCGLSLAMVLYGFPSLLSIFGGLPKGFQNMETGHWSRYGRWLHDNATPLTIACVVVFVVGTAGLQWFRTETKAIRYFPEESRIVQDYHFLEEGLAGVVTVDTVVGFKGDALQQHDILERIEIVRNVQEQIRQVDGVSGSMSLADFRPTRSSQPASALQHNLAVRRTEQELFGENSASASQLVTHVREPLDVERDGIVVKFEEGEEIWRIRAQSVMLADIEYSDLLADMNAAVSTALEEQSVGTEFVVTGMVPLFLRTQQAVLESLIRSFGLAFCLIAAVMMILLKNPLSGLLSMLPNVMPVGVVFGAISYVGVPVDVGTMITASVALGVAVDGTLHLLTWFQNGVSRGLSRRESLAAALSHCGPAMWQTSAAISLAMLMLAGADLLMISRFGWLMSALIAAALVADLVFMPALLAGPLGALIERTTRTSTTKKTPPPTEPVTAAHDHALGS